VLHQACFKCSECKAHLQISNYTTVDDAVFCKTHGKARTQQSHPAASTIRTSSTNALPSEQQRPAVRELSRGRSETQPSSFQTGKSLPAAAKAFSGQSGESSSKACAVCSKNVYPVEQVGHCDELSTASRMFLGERGWFIDAQGLSSLRALQQCVKVGQLCIVGWQILCKFLYAAHSCINPTG
jgi:hypothetical protein